MSSWSKRGAATTARSEVSAPIPRAERFVALDTLRGLALLGVLLVNLESDFRVSLAQHLLTFHTHPGPLDRATDLAIAGLLEFKAFTLFAVLFGVGMTVFVERASTRLLARRLLALLGIGLAHLLLLWNGDILTLYALCGFVVLPALRLSTGGLVALGVAAFAAPYVVPWGLPFPSEATLRGLVDDAARTYGHGEPIAVVAFHARETRDFIVPLLVGVLPRTVGLMALGAAVGKRRVFAEPEKHGRLLRPVALLGLLVGGAATALKTVAESRGVAPLLPGALLDAAGSAPLALGYGAGFLLLPARWRALGPVAAAGRMALSNYLAQSVVLSALFYGLGLFGKLGPAAAAGIGIGLYVLQCALSAAWLRRFRFGPAEWLWRTLTYGRLAL